LFVFDQIRNAGRSNECRTEEFSRMVKSAITTVKSTDHVLCALQATTETSKLMPLFEIEEITELARSSGETGIACLIGLDATVYRMFKKKEICSQAGRDTGALHFSENSRFFLQELDLIVLHGNEDLLCFLEPASEHLF